ncbi:6-phosphogluconolactonase [Enterovibrio paralichthyis]|uniref:6-phosphogluconolactonase n=1 Tax=Enterovibrio paralichthyis TaxID=2853805 RepID=UPI001C47A90C|nr:6-phosphogluconolactonase [Enterovibrio paralichthyis]MBV7297267.1 6-phosphogluconolactonase [Enterovibrio paralichthyis]
MKEFRILDNADAVVLELAASMKSLSEQGRPVHISLSGGSTPKLLFKLLAQPEWANSIQWQNLHFWWGDERCVAPDDAESNYGEANALLFSQIAIPAENIHRIRGEDDAQQEAKRLADEIKAEVPEKNGLPAFDWILLGMGDDGHTASLFPGQTDYDEPALTLVAAHPQSGQLRVSKSARLLNNADRISYLVLGAGKAEMIEAIHGKNAKAGLPYPAAHIASAHGITEWYLDAAAAKTLA